MTVKELIEKLKEFDEEFVIAIESEETVYEAKGIYKDTIWPTKDAVLISIYTND